MISLWIILPVELKNGFSGPEYGSKGKGFNGILPKHQSIVSSIFSCGTGVRLFFCGVCCIPHPTFTEVRYNYPSHWFKCLVGYNIYTPSLVEYFNPCLFLCCVVVKCSTLGFWMIFSKQYHERTNSQSTLNKDTSFLLAILQNIDCTNSICFAN